MLSEDPRCLVCLDSVSNLGGFAQLDVTCQFSEQSYLSLVNVILSPVVFEPSVDPLLLCRTCQGLADDYEHHQLQAKKVKNGMLLRYRNVHSNRAPGITDKECYDSSSGIALPLERELPHPACPDLQALEPIHHDNTIHNQTSDIKPSKPAPLEQQKSASQSRLWTVSDDGQTYQCTLCNKKFAHRSYMYTHVRIHTGVRPHACSSCSRSFRSSSALSEHFRSAHSVGAQFSCEVCGQTFMHASSLRQHLRQHRQQPSHRCADCGKAFHRATQLREHETVHSQRRPHNCPVCGKTFKTKSGLMYHSRIHGGERPHQCRVCHARFRTSSNLSRHVQTQHGGSTTAADARADRANPPPPPPLPPLPPPAVAQSQQLSDSAGQPPRFDLLQPTGLEVTVPEFGLTCHHPAATRGLPGAAPSLDRPLHELLPVPLEVYRPL